MPILAEKTGRLDAVLAEAVDGVSRARIAAWIRAGHVRVEGEVVTRPSAKIGRGSRIEVDAPEPRSATAQPQDLPVDIVYQDADLVVVNKAPGMVVHPGAGHPDGTLVNALLHHVGDLSGVGGVVRPGIVHRLDRGTSGLLVVAKNDAAHQALSGQFADRTAGRTYLAIVYGLPREDRGVIDAAIGRHRTQRVRFTSVDPSGEAKRAETHWEVLGRARDRSLIQCQLQTGRTHQIRVHLSENGWPLVGDGLYGRKKDRRKALDDRPFLHAWRLRFAHPVSGELVAFEAEPPDDFRTELAKSGLDDPTR